MILNGILNRFNDIDAIAFDFDDTLQDRKLAFLKYARDFVSRFFPLLPLEEYERRVNDMTTDINGGYIDRTVFYSGLIKKWNWNEAPDTTVLEADYDNVFPKFSTLFPDAVETVKGLRKRGYRVGILSNGPHLIQHNKLDATGITPLFDAVVVSGDYGIHKPAREIFDITARLLKTPNERILYVGDHPVNDISGALGAGMKAVRMKHGPFAEKPVPPQVPSIDSLSELL